MNAAAFPTRNATAEAAHWHALQRMQALEATQQAQLMACLTASPRHLCEYMAVLRVAAAQRAAGRSQHGAPQRALSARRANIGQLSQLIQTWSAGNAVLVMMDCNTRYTRADDNIRALTASNGLTDAWLELAKGSAPTAGAEPLLCGTPPTNTCEVVDNIRYRDAPQLTLVANRYQLNPGNFYDSAGKPLSDH
ncbi:hypothetical protein ATB53_01240 [Xanthomonas translucens]|uniref:Uncharacterized protein n=1 Tax=Xanthomonas campestris pv. translucens TaxID=343 RepID=A0A109HH53_XANCT|nr:hypothetical protein ATB53_01240 [Xanthomonas translucens]